MDLNARRGRLTVSVDKQEGGVAHAALSFPVSVSNQVIFGGKSETRATSHELYDRVIFSEVRFSRARIKLMEISLFIM